LVDATDGVLLATEGEVGEEEEEEAEAEDTEVVEVEAALTSTPPPQPPLKRGAGPKNAGKPVIW
jgi:hypothetical protein